MNVPVKLSERPVREQDEPASSEYEKPQPSSRPQSSLGMSVRELDAELLQHLDLPSDQKGGVVVSRVDPMSPAFDADIQRGHVLLEINRQPVKSVEDYRRLVAAAKSGDVLTLYIYKPGVGRTLQTIRID